jgi:hypothetical protein
MAKKKSDPAMPDREISTEDYDYDHLMKVYADVIELFKK